ncbi:MAG TPA: valine--tRNA ligase [Candidatus Paceibacterota bacterium]|nr:valine--tRNA ligase [Candidatus Paceibacterota bacterium]
MNEKFTKPYDPQGTESRIYEIWEKSEYFNPDNLPERHKTPFTIVMPPPNANGDLHVGHSLFITLEDVITRYKRMKGFKALWIPGADHAGFETQIVYEKKLEKEGRSRFKMDSQDLYKEIYDFTIENKAKMENQVRQMGASCDWSREKFTLDPDVVETVQQTFKKMYDDGLVYRGNRIVNWCSKHQTSLSDVETESKPFTDPFYYFKYGPFTIGTARPETKFGDKYVVMHPDDKRYIEYKHGDTFETEWINGPITATIIKDEAIDMEFGTGVMTITPWHSQIDFEIAQRHNLDVEQIIDLRGKLLPIAGEFAGMKIAEARPKIVDKLDKKGLLVKIDEKYDHNVPCCYKCNTIIEPQIKAQWYVKMKPLAETALKAVEDGKISFYPDNYRKIFNYWMSNTLDWNISRQIVWGIKIPAKICTKCGHGVPDTENKISVCEKCESEMVQDTDTFDTWFSSGQWPLIVTGYPDGKDFKEFYPTDVMETGYDLIFKWIPRMVIFGLYVAKEVPFKHVYLHGLVNDAQGKKMSKSKGNVINPLDMTSKYGTDALRMALVVGNPPGSDTALSESKIKGYKNFANKLWNISRFVFSNTEGLSLKTNTQYAEADAVLLKELTDVVTDITSDFEEYRYHLAAEKIYHYVWHRFADEILEQSKPIIAGEDISLKTSRQQTLLYILHQSITVLHPFMPFITEEIWAHFPKEKEGDLLMVSEWAKK